MNQKKSVRSCLLVAFLAVAIAMPAAGARGAQGPKPQSGKPASPVVIEVRHNGFDWQDAGVGAAAMLALVAIGYGLTLVVRDRPDLRPSTERE